MQNLMQNLKIEKLRNIVLLSHSGAGKTSLVESLLFNTGTISRMGKIEDGNTSSDYEPEEVKRGSSTQISLIPCFSNSYKINFIDTPGYADFLGEVIAGLRVADGGIVVIAAPSGIEVGTEHTWTLLDKQSTPRIVFVNKMDRENADFARTVDALRERFGRSCVATHIPIGSDASFIGIINLLDATQDYPSELTDYVEIARERLTEVLAESDDELATKYLEGKPISKEELKEALRKGVSVGEIIPVMPGSATSGIGISELLDVVIDYIPSPSSSVGQQGEPSQANPEGNLASLVFKTSADSYVGKISYFRVYNGTFKSDTQVWNSHKEQVERVGQLFTFRGKNQEQVLEVIAGDIGVVTKLAFTATGDTLCNKEAPVTLPMDSFPIAHHTVAVYPKSKQDVDKMSASLARIAEEDPSLKVSRDADTGEVLLAGLGDVHVDVTGEKIKRKFGIDLILQTPKIPYKETITATTKVEYKHKKQSGGHGQYGHVFLELEPMPKSGGFEFSSMVVGGNVPREYFQAVEKGIMKSLDEGAVAGYPVVDIKVVLYDGSSHPVDSSGMSFEIAGGYAFRKGLGLAQPVLLEPIMSAEINVPDNFTGEVTGDLNTKRGRIIGMTPQDGYTTIDAEVPQAEMLRYSTDLRSLTQGRGSFSIQFNHYEAVPTHLNQKIAEESKKSNV